MRYLIQRVKHATLSVDDKVVSSIKHGLCVCLGVTKGDNEEIAKKVAHKIANIRIFELDGKMNLSVQDVKGEILLVSNFTLCTEEKKSGARPYFGLSAERETAIKLYELVASELNALGVPTQTGVFGADMQIDTHLDGPVTIYQETI